MEPVLTTAERRLRSLLKLLLFIDVVMLFFHLLPRWTPDFLDQPVAIAYLALAAGSTVVGGLAGLLLIVSIGDLRRFSALIRLINIYLAAALVWWTIRWISEEAELGSYIADTTLSLAVVTLLLFLLFQWAERQRYRLKYLSAMQFVTLQAIAEVCIAGESKTDKLQISPHKVALNVDDYLSRFDAKSKWVMKLVLSCMQIYPMLSLHVPLSLMIPGDRLNFLKRRFLTDEAFRAMPDWYRQLIQAAIRMSKQLCYMGYYSDPDVFKSVGYSTFVNRKDYQQRMTDFPDNFSLAHQLKVETPGDIGSEIPDADVVIVGTGAGASILAHQLTAAGRKVLMIERGHFRKPADFTDNEVDMVSSLYSDGALQLSRDFRFQVFQGSCVGGSTVVNNAVCFETPTPILDRWIGPMGIDIDRERYLRSMREVYRLIDVEHGPEMCVDTYLNPGGTLFSNAAKKAGFHTPNLDSVSADIRQCLGCGYCNIGCKFGKKLSMLDHILPATPLKHPGSLRIIADCSALSFSKKGNRIVSLTAQLTNGRKIVIKGNTFISSAGAISSSILLIKSHLGIANAGKKLAFNLGSQLTAAYDHVVNSYDGLQISHFLKTGDPRFVMETWYNPPMFQSTAMPGWFDQHFRNMQDYGKMACTGILVGTSSNAEVTTGGLLGRNIDYVPTEDDFDSLMEGLQKAGEIYFEGGVERVMPNSFSYYEYRTAADMKNRFRKDIKSSRDISTGTGHPQGGNVMSNDASSGVVDPGFKVFGFDNLFVCDASVFPTSLGVNPQITVMSLAHYAAPLIANNS
jgi:choline dehydrogenase-like flavoprotein